MKKKFRNKQEKFESPLHVSKLRFNVFEACGRVPTNLKKKKCLKPVGSGSLSIFIPAIYIPNKWKQSLMLHNM